MTEQPHLGHGARGPGQLGALGLGARGRVEGGGTPHGVQDVEVSRRRGGRGRSRRQVSRGDRDARPDLGGVAGGPARVEAVALAGEVGAADQVGRHLLRGLPGADPAQREALVDDAVDLPLEVRGDGAVPDGVGRQQGGGLLLAGGPQRAVVTPAAGDQGSWRPTAVRRHRSRWCGGGASEILETQWGKAEVPLSPTTPKVVKCTISHTGVLARAGTARMAGWRGGMEWSGRRDSNSRHRPWEGRALPTELRPQQPDAAWHLVVAHATGWSG